MVAECLSGQDNHKNEYSNDVCALTYAFNLLAEELEFDVNFSRVGSFLIPHKNELHLCPSRLLHTFKKREESSRDDMTSKQGSLLLLTLNDKIV